MSKRITNQHLVKIGNAALAFGILTSTVAGTLLLVTTPASAAAVPTSSAVTVDWSTDHTDTTDPNYAAFADLKLSVSQTKNLVNQAVTVSWSGAKQTTPGEYAADYMQIMECWGDESTGPTPEQCQWGAPTAAISGLMGNRASSRDLSVGDDPAQDPYLNGATPDPDLLIPAPQENPNLRAYRVPFRSVTGELAKTNIAISKVFSASTTNEVSAARTGNDGSGQVAFEAQTALEAPQLGCGNAVTGTDGKVTPQGCWLVVVPRGELNPDGSVYTSQTAGRLVGSPLTASVWKNRMVVPLGFQSVSQSCPIGNAEQRIVGSEMIAEAITSWQPALCQSGSTYGYSLLGDGEARRQIVSTLGGASRLAIVADPLDADTADGATIAYAPVAESAVVIAFNIDYKLFSNATNAEQNGLQVEDLTLNARLVAKLLTQSYRLDVPGRGAKDTVINSNPLSILNDPEFLSLNPQFKGFTTDSDPAGLMVALGSTDANALVWSWLRSDPLARAFLAGEPDDNGMTINPNYLALGLATDSSTDSFPKADLTVTGTDSDQPGYSTLDMRPYMNDMHEGAYRTLKADPNVKTSWDPFGTPPSYKSTGAQIPGTRFVLSVTDAASAARYGLTVAKLVNGAGQAVAPTAATIGKGVANMVDSGTGGVLVNDTDARAAGAYPLPLLSYAAVNVCESTTGELQDYAALIDYAVGAGQVSGDARGSLPRGYVPLGATLVAQAKSAASALTDTAAVSAKCDVPVTPPATTVTTAPAPVVTSSTPAPTPTPTPTPTATRTPKPQATTTPPAVVPAPVPSVTTPPVDEPVVEDPEVPADPQSTTDQPLSAGRAGLAGALALGFPSMIAGPLLARRGRKLARLSELDD